jgi:hypothetical protein
VNPGPVTIVIEKNDTDCFAVAKVYAPVGGTYWDLFVSCPPAGELPCGTYEHLIYATSPPVGAALELQNVPGATPSIRCLGIARGQRGLGGSPGTQGPTGPGGGSISLEPNAGLTNSGITYSTIYNTLVTETTKVPGEIGDQVQANLHPLTWLRGLTAGYFSQKNIVEVLDMILFPAVPFAYTPPSLSISPVAVAPTPTFPTNLVLISSTPYKYNFTLNYNDGNPNATASQYSWECRVNTGSFNLIGSVCDSSSTSVSSSGQFPSGITFSVSTPTTYTIRGTVSHQASAICNDTAGNPTPLPLENQAGIEASGTIGFSAIFPYYYGKVSCNCNSTNFNGTDVTTFGNQEIALANSPITVPGFNTSNLEKGFLATPQSLGNQTQIFFKQAKDLVTNIIYPINNLHTPSNPVLFGGSSFSVAGVTINGISHTYSVYLFQYGSATTADFLFTS